MEAVVSEGAEDKNNLSHRPDVYKHHMLGNSKRVTCGVITLGPPAIQNSQHIFHNKNKKLSWLFYTHCIFYLYFVTGDMIENFPKHFRPLRLLVIGEGGLMISFHPIIYGNKNLFFFLILK